MVEKSTSIFKKDLWHVVMKSVLPPRTIFNRTVERTGLEHTTKTASARCSFKWAHWEASELKVSKLSAMRVNILLVLRVEINPEELFTALKPIVEYMKFSGWKVWGRVPEKMRRIWIKK